jgi:hypothetical protein
LHDVTTNFDRLRPNRIVESSVDSGAVVIRGTVTRLAAKADSALAVAPLFAPRANRTRTNDD